MSLETDRTTGFYQQSLETLSPDERSKYLSAELQKIVSHAYQNAPAIKKKI